MDCQFYFLAFGSLIIAVILCFMVTKFYALLIRQYSIKIYYHDRIFKYCRDIIFSYLLKNLLP